MLKKSPLFYYGAYRNDKVFKRKNKIFIKFKLRRKADYRFQTYPKIFL